MLLNNNYCAKRISG